MTYKSRPQPSSPHRKPQWFDLPGQHEPYGRGRGHHGSPQRDDDRAEREHGDDERRYNRQEESRPFQSAPGHEEEVSGARGRGAYGLNPGDERGHARGGAGFRGVEGDDRGWQGDLPSRNDRASHAGKGPRNYVRSDTRIREDVCDCLTDDHHVDASNIDVKVEHGEVMLYGHVAERGMKQAAENAAWNVSGVKDVDNRLKVRREHELDEEVAQRAKPQRAPRASRSGRSPRSR